MNELDQGFSPENIERIYLGEPPLVYGEPIEDALSDRQHQVTKLYAGGLTHQQIAAELGTTQSSTTALLSRAYNLLGVNYVYGLASYFPLDLDDPKLENRILGEFSPLQLQILEGLSKGLSCTAIAEELNYNRNTVGSNLKRTTSIWSDLDRPLEVIKVANAIRATYTQEYTRRGGDISKRLGEFALPSIVSYEPQLRNLAGLATEPAMAVV